MEVESVLRWCGENGTDIVSRGDQDYPQQLEDLPDAPPVLFVRGQVTSEDELAVAIVGTRHATTYGLRQAERFGYSLARAGVTVVSGLARGIDVGRSRRSIQRVAVARSRCSAAASVRSIPPNIKDLPMRWPPTEP